MLKIAITAGNTYVDIDGLACVLAYAELLTKQKLDAEPAILGPLNQSVVPTVKTWKLDYTDKLSSNPNLVLMDISDPDYIQKYAYLDKVIEIYDHHFGFEDFWHEKLKDKAHIEFIGACATLIWEEFRHRGQADQISTSSANLLSTAIVSNTLNFNAAVTHDRDRQAFDELQSHADLPKNWIKDYYRELEQDVVTDLARAIKNDTQAQVVQSLGKVVVIGQLELWDSQSMLEKNQQELEKVMESFGYDDWFLTSPSISQGKNYILANNPAMQKLLQKIFPIKFDGDIGTTKKLWLRKGIIKKLEELDPEH